MAQPEIRAAILSEDSPLIRAAIGTSPSDASLATSLGSGSLLWRIFPLGERLDATPWLGNRPCTPDMMPVIGPAPRHKNLTFAFGHAHHGLTLAAVTGRMVAEMVTGEPVFVNPEPFRPGRF
jgi:hypothetical protein